MAKEHPHFEDVLYLLQYRKMVIFHFAMFVFGYFSLNMLKPTIHFKANIQEKPSSEGPPSLPWQTSNPALMETFVGRADQGGGFRYFLCSSRKLGKMIQFEGCIFFFKWVGEKPPTRDRTFEQGVSC